MADLKFRTGASATVQKEDSLEKKLAGIIGTSQGAIKSLESQLRREREAEEAQKKAEEEARKRAEAAAVATATASVQTQTPAATTGSTSKPIDTQYIKDLQKQRAQLQSAASTGDRTAMQKINEINRLLQEAQKGATAPTAPTVPTAQPTRDFSWETDETVLQREKELASAKTGVAREAQRKSENYVERQGRKLDAMEEELKRLRAAAHNGDTESGKAYNELLGQYNTALDLYNQASTLANRREAQFYEGIEEVRQINQQIAGTQKYSDEAGAVYEAEYNAAKDALQAATTLASDYSTAVVPGYSDYIYNQVKAAEDRFAQADEAFTLWKQEREAYLREKTLRGIPSEDLSLFREVLNDRNRDIEATLRQKYGEEYDTILMFMRRQANAEKWKDRGTWISDRGAVGDALLSVASVATNLLSAPGVIYEYIVQGKNGDRYLPLDTNAGGFWMQNATRKIRESVTDDIESDAWDLIYQTAMSGIDSYLTARLFGSKATYVLGATAGANAATDITERGGTVQQAIVGGILAGAIEGFFEDFSIGQMQALQSQNLKMNTLKDAVDLENIKTLIANIAKSTGVNFSEEANTEMANIVMDTLLMGDLSEITMSVQRLMAEDPNLDERAAKKIVAKELATQVILSGVSGALMGAAFGAIDTATAGFRTYALNADTREVLRQAQQTAATLPWEWRPEFRYEAGASYEQINSYAEKVYNAAQEYLVEMQNSEALNPEETASVRDEVSNLVNVRVRTKTTVDKVLAAEEAGRAAADAESSVSPQIGENAQDANVVGAEENAQAVGTQQASEAVTLARELLQEHTNTYSGEALAREVANTVQILKNEGRFDISDALEAEYNNYINGGNTNGEAGQAGVLLSDGQGRVYAESAGRQAGADGRAYERGSAAGGTRAESTQSGSGVQQTVWKPQVKSSELVASGTNKTVRMVPEAEYSNENYADAVAEIKRAGFTPVLVRDALTVRSTNGKNLRVNGAATPDGRIVLRVGADKTQNRKLGRHEIFHAMFMKAKNRAAIMDRILTTLKNKYSEAEITDMLNVYFDKYRNTYSDENRIIEEFLADAYAGMNRFDEAKVDKYEKAVVGAATAESLATETEENGDAGDWYADGGNNANANLTFAVPYDRISQNPRYKQLYAEAKSGDDVAAAKLVNALTNRDFFETIRKKFAGSTLLPLMGRESVSDNVLPNMLARKISRITGLPVEDRVFKTTSNHMRSRSPEERLTENIDFDIDAENTAELSGKHFVIVDDTIATGTTVNSLARWIEAHGGVVDGFVSLAKGKDTVSSFQITPEQIRMLERRYGRNAVETVIRKYGYADRIEDLTRRQADIIDRKHAEFGLTPIDSRRGTRNDRENQSKGQSRRTSSLKPNEATEENLDGFSIAEETDNPDIRYSVEETEEERMVREDTKAREGVIRQFAEDYGLADRIEDARDVAAGRKEFSDLDLDNSNDLHNMADLVRRFLQAKNSGYDRILAEFGGLKINETAAPKPPEPKVSAFRSNTLKKILGDKAEKYFRTEDYTYLPISEQESLRSARDRLNTDAEGVIEYLRKSEGWGSSDMDAAYAIMGILKHEADVTHDYSRLNEWVKLMREQNTRAGQMIQANAKYSRNPYTLLLKADEIIETLRQEAVKNKANEQEMQGVEDLVNKIHENTSNQIAAIEAAGENVNSLVDVILKNAEIRKNKISRRIINSLRTQDVDFLRNVAIAQVENIAVDNVRRSAAQKISTYQTMAQLLNLRTGMRNVTSNQVFDVLESFVTNVSAPVDAFIGLMTKQRGVGLDASWFSKEKRQGAKNAAVRSAIEVSLDVEVGDGNSKYGTKNRRTWNMQTSGVVGRTMSRLEKVMGYELNVTDEFLKGSVYSEAMRGFQKFIDNGTLSLEDAQEMARQEALYRSFQDDTKFSQLLRKTKEALNIVGIKNGHLSFGLGDFVQKYTQVPGALISRAVEFSPLGYIKAIAAACQIRHNGNINVMAQRQTALSFGRATTGTGLIVAFATLAKLGILRRRDDEENKDVAALSDSEGIYGTQINWSALMRLLRGEDTAWKKGDVLIDFDFMEPINAIMAIGTAVAGSEGETFGERAKAVGKESLAALFDSILESSLFQNWQQLTDAIRYSQSEGLDAWTDYGMGFIASSITGFVPSLVRQIAQATDYAYRDQYYSQNKKSQVFARFINTIPGLRQALPEKLDNFGDVKDYEDPWINALNSLVMPGGIYVYERGEISEELARLREATGEDGMYPSRYAPYNLELNLGGGKREKHELTPEERTRFQTTRGTTASLLMAEYMASTAYENASDEQRAAVLTTIKNIAEDAAKRELYESLGIQYRTDTHDKYYGLVAAGVSSANALDLQYRNSALQKYYSFLSDGATDSADAQLALLKEMGVEITGVQNLDKLALIRQYNVPNAAFVEMATEFINDSRGEDFAIMLDAGLTQEDVELLFNEYTRLSKDESMSAFDKATEFAHYVDVMGIKNDARNVVLDTLTYSSGFRATADTYQKYVDAGLDADTAKTVYDALGALEPEAGKESVSELQKLEVIVSKTSNVEDQISAYVATVSADDREKTEEKLRDAYKVGITPTAYVDYLKSTKDLNAKDANGETVTNLKKARVTLAIHAMNLTKEQKDYLWLLSYKEKGLNKTPWHTGRTYSSAEEYVKYL